jgi:hypothetical protein
MRYEAARSAGERRDARAATAAPPSSPASGTAAVLALQRSHGNAAVAALLARAPVTPTQPVAYAPAPKPQDGLIDSGAAARLAAAAEHLGSEWDALATAEARADVLVRVANDELRALRVPPFKVNLGDLHQAGGLFVFATWTMQLNAPRSQTSITRP